MPPLRSKSHYPQLCTFLDREDVRDAGLTAAYFEGFATAVACGPPVGGIQGFLDLLLGDDLPPFEGEDEVQAVISAVFERYNELAQVLRIDPTRFQPDVCMEEVEDWATGFGRAMSLDVQAWNDLAADRERGMTLMPILAFARGETTGRPMVEEFGDADAEGREELAGHIPQVVPMIAAHFRAMGKQPGPGMSVPPSANVNEPRRHKKVGRNALCPCGSGKKYKTCCGG